jgi:hypothetical protein
MVVIVACVVVDEMVEAILKLNAATRRRGRVLLHHGDSFHNSESSKFSTRHPTLLNVLWQAI